MSLEELETEKCWEAITNIFASFAWWVKHEKYEGINGEDTMKTWKRIVAARFVLTEMKNNWMTTLIHQPETSEGNTSFCCVCDNGSILYHTAMNHNCTQKKPFEDFSLGKIPIKNHTLFVTDLSLFNQTLSFSIQSGSIHKIRITAKWFHWFMSRSTLREFLFVKKTLEMR